jgi:hypothetical protein
MVAGRRQRLDIDKMKEQVAQHKAPTAKTMEQIHEAYLSYLKEQGAKGVVVDEPSVNWRAVIMSLPAPQPSRVLGCGLRRVWLKEYDCVYDGIYRFHAERLDGTFASFDWRDAYNDPYHAYFKKSFRDDVVMALRAAVLHHLIEYKENQPELISDVSGKALTWEHAVVQHYPTQANFRELVTSFLNTEQVGLDKIPLEYDEKHVYIIADKGLLARWVAYHASAANYRIVSLDEASAVSIDPEYRGHPLSEEPDLY